MDDFNESGSLALAGLYPGGTKYMVIQGEPGAVIRGKFNFLKKYILRWFSNKIVL